jgi:hypothetical protein
MYHGVTLFPKDVLVRFEKQCIGRLAPVDLITISIAIEGKGGKYP